MAAVKREDHGGEGCPSSIAMDAQTWSTRKPATSSGRHPDAGRRLAIPRDADHWRRTLRPGARRRLSEGVTGKHSRHQQSNPADGVIGCLGLIIVSWRLLSRSTDALNQFLQTVENRPDLPERAATMGNSATAQRLSSAVDMNGSLSRAAENVMTGNTPGLMRQAWQWLQSDAAPSESSGRSRRPSSAAGAGRD